MAVPKFRQSVLVQARERRNLTQLQMAALADEATTGQPVQPPHSAARDPARDTELDRVRRINAWESRIAAWERGTDSPSAHYVPTLARLLDVEPLALFEVDPAAPPFTALRLAAGFTLKDLSEAAAISYTSLHRMMRGTANAPEVVADRLAQALNVTPAELLAALERER